MKKQFKAEFKKSIGITLEHRFGMLRLMHLTFIKFLFKLCLTYSIQQIIQMTLLERLKEELQIERERYSRTKIGKFFAFLIIVAIMKVGPMWLNCFWPYISHLPQSYIFTMIVLFNMLFWSVFFNSFVYLFSKWKIPWIEKYRISPELPRPWEETDPEKKKEMDSIVRYNLLHGGIKYLILMPAVALATAGDVGNLRMVMDMSSWPSPIEMMPHLIIMLVVEDIYNFFAHWAFHHPLLYRFHKEHHEYKHPIPVASWHFHYLQFLALQMVAANLYLNAAAHYAPIHISTIMVWYIFRIWNNNMTHCGYVFPFVPTSLLPFCLNDDFHDFHHSHNQGNYGLYFRILDICFGQTKAFREYKAKQRALEQKIE